MSDTTQILKSLQSLFAEIVRSLSKGDEQPERQLGVNPKGDRIRWFDMAAHQAVCAYLEERFPYPVTLLSEEAAPHSFGSGSPAFTLVLDPVDGSVNFARGLAPSGVALALIPASTPLAVETVQFALTGDLRTGDTWVAARGRGAFHGQAPLHTHPVARLEAALVSCDFSNSVMTPPLVRLLSRALNVRSFGSAVWSLTMVAAGALDVHLDVRSLLTAENFLAPALLITESGGVITDPSGDELPAVGSLQEGYSVLAAATPGLHADLVRRLAHVAPPSASRP